MVVTRVAKVTLGFYISFIVSLAVVAFMSFPLGVYLGAPVACFVLAVVGGECFKMDIGRYFLVGSPGLLFWAFLLW
jgi:hypothetical protein